jgi:hypothetical protein
MRSSFLFIRSPYVLLKMLATLSWISPSILLESIIIANSLRTFCSSKVALNEILYLTGSKDFFSMASIVSLNYIISYKIVRFLNTLLSLFSSKSFSSLRNMTIYSNSSRFYPSWTIFASNYLNIYNQYSY